MSPFLIPLLHHRNIILLAPWTTVNSSSSGGQVGINLYAIPMSDVPLLIAVWLFLIWALVELKS